MSYTYQYPRPALTVDILLFSKKEDIVKVLLIQRNNDPFRNKWAFPGGFIEMDEPLETSPYRELAEETGVKDVKLTQLHTFGQLGRDPRGRTISVVYYAFVDDAGIHPKAGDDAGKAKWFCLSDLPELAFDHDEILNYAIKELKI